MPSLRHTLTGSVVAVGMVAALSGAMFPLRSHLSVATTALVLVVPVVVGVAVGGFGAGLVATATGFLVYDFVFIPPYYTLSVGAAQNWVALGVFAAVMIVVSQVVARLDAVRSEAQNRAAEVRRLFDLSEILVRDLPQPELLETIVMAVREAFDLEGAALLLPRQGRLELAATAGASLSEEELLQLSADGRGPVSLESAAVQRGAVQAVALSAGGLPIGLLALRGLSGVRRDHELLRAFANHLALALERMDLREHALRAQLLEEADRLRQSLVGAVSHDLRTPLATIKVSTSTLLDPETPVSWEDLRELVALIDVQANRLDRLVANLLDMTRIQAGALELRRQKVSVADLVTEARTALGPSPELDRLVTAGLEALPLVDVDPLLVCQVLANLIDNAVRHAPGESDITVTAGRDGRGTLEISVTDHGPGIPAEERRSVFHMFNRRQAGGRGGLGLAIAHAFIEAHGQRIWVDDGPGGGACFTFTVAEAA